MDGQATFDPGACAPPQRTLDDAVSPSTIRLKRASTIAEIRTYLLCALLDLPGQAESRFYIQGWLQGGTLPEKSAKRIFGAADRIMKAGQPVQH